MRSRHLLDHGRDPLTQLKLVGCDVESLCRDGDGDGRRATGDGRRATGDGRRATGDNEITKDEFARLMRDVWKDDSPETMDLFTKLDTDGDGAISRYEFIRAVREHFLSSDPDAPGSIFFGHI